ncbi:MAG: protein kinase [Armatimonas sp.]
MRVGEQIGPYEIRAKVGEGGMAEVWQVYHRDLQRIEAMKVIKAGFRNDRDFVARFLDEARRTAGLRHTNIAVVYTTSGPGDTIPYFTMEYLEGEDLASYGARYAPMDVRVVRELLAPVASALDYAHSQGVVHRDIKPANIHIDTTGRVRVLDFGIARAASGSQGNMTLAGQIVGTPAYMSPEQAGSGKPICPQSDQYSLAIVAYELLTGLSPFTVSNEGALTQLMVAHVHTPPQDPRVYGVSAGVASALLRALAKTPGERFPDCASFLKDWDSIPLPPPSVQPVRSSGFPVAVALGVLTLLLGGGLVARSVLAPKTDTAAIDTSPPPITPAPDSTPPPAGLSPNEVVRNYVTALNKGNAREAYDLRSVGYRNKNSLDFFRQRMSSDYGGFQSEPAHIEGETATVPIHFQSRETEGIVSWEGPVDLVLEEGQWKIDTWKVEKASEGIIRRLSPEPPVPQHTTHYDEPIQVIQNYFNAINRRDRSAYDLYYSRGFKSKMPRSTWISDHFNTTHDMAIHSTGDTDIRDDWAFVPTTWLSTEPEGRKAWTNTITLKRESDGWKIHSFLGKTD